jgi:hypothetical protein
MVDARDQVLITRLGTPGWFISSIRRKSFGSTYGPFFSDLDTPTPPRLTSGAKASI